MMNRNLNKQLQEVEATPKEEMIPVNGRGQIIDMLRSVDPAFRETILRNLEKRDPRLARALRAAL